MYIQEREVSIMTTTIQKWGNSHGIRLPKHLLEVLQCSDNDEITISAVENRLIIEKASPKSRPSIAELFADYDGEYEAEEIDWGEPVGGEVW